jgi:hypothetical protein
MAHCRKCGEQAQYLLEISANIQNDIHYCLPCIQKAFIDRAQTNNSHV